mgnify:CR=1 FL=1
MRIKTNYNLNHFEVITRIASLQAFLNSKNYDLLPSLINELHLKTRWNHDRF